MAASSWYKPDVLPPLLEWRNENAMAGTLTAIPRRAQLLHNPRAKLLRSGAQGLGVSWCSLPTRAVSAGRTTVCQCKWSD